MGKGWSKGLTKESDARVARYAEARSGLRYRRHSAAEGDRQSDPVTRADTIVWTPRLAYAVGLIATDGCLLNTGRHIAFTSADRELMETFLDCVGRPGGKYRTVLSRAGTPVHYAQFGDVRLCRWLVSIGLTQRKSLTLGAIAVPDEMFFPLVRGLLDGDGSVMIYFHAPNRRAYPTHVNERLYVSFCSASKAHVLWLQHELERQLGITGAILVRSRQRLSSNPFFNLQYAKHASIALLTELYEDASSPRLQRKWAIWDDYRLRNLPGTLSS